MQSTNPFRKIGVFLVVVKRGRNIPATFFYKSAGGDPKRGVQVLAKRRQSTWP